jgi:hypothetical protein
MHMMTQRQVHKIRNVILWLFVILTIPSISAIGVQPVVEEVYAFDPDIRYPSGGIVQGVDGDFYGLTLRGGNSGPPAAFKISSGGKLTVLARLDKVYPSLTLTTQGFIQGADGNFYWSLYTSTNTAFIMKMTPNGLVTQFAALPDQSGAPNGRLLQAKDGNLYVATTNTANYGKIFRVSSAGTVDLFYKFSDGSYSNPTAGIVQGNDGAFYGTAASSSPLFFKLYTAS